MQIKKLPLVVSGLLIFSCSSTNKLVQKEAAVKFYVDPEHANPCISDLGTLGSCTVKGELIFTRAPLNEILKQLSSL